MFEIAKVVFITYCRHCKRKLPIIQIGNESNLLQIVVSFYIFGSLNVCWPFKSKNKNKTKTEKKIYNFHNLHTLSMQHVDKCN